MLNKLYITIFFLLVISACNSKPLTPSPEAVGEDVLVATQSLATVAPTWTPTPPRQLSVCMPRDPESLFLYGPSSNSARSIQQAIYDGPFDRLNFDYAPVILEERPGSASGAVSFAPAQVFPNDLMIDSSGNLVNLGEGVSYLPAGCAGQGCAQVYAGQEAVSIDQMVVRYRMRPGLTWSDGSPLTADDSLYSYEVARALGLQGRAELLSHTFSYQALDETTLEWRGLPGLRDPDYAAYFFSPLPRQAYTGLTPSQLLTSTLSARTPPGWGPYRIVDYQPGEQILLEKNPTYFRAAEALPHFDRLIFRFVPDPAQAFVDLRSGNCDLLDGSYNLTPADLELQSLQAAGEVALVQIPNTAWEHLDFGIQSQSLDLARAQFFTTREVRQAVAQCVDRQKIVSELAPGQAVLDLYLPPEHPLYNIEARRYPYDPAASGALLDSLGWMDADGDPLTPRLSAGVAGVPDGTPFGVSLVTGDSPEQVRIAQLLRDSLAQCGIQLEIDSRPSAEAFAPGPDGPVFGRNFSLAQFAWPFGNQPGCDLFLTQAIPGPYPDYPLGWGGANVSGYTNPQFDQACQQALNSLPEDPEQRQAHWLSQAIFAEDIPVLPLFTRSRWVVIRPDLCGIVVDLSNPDIYWNLENFDYGENCR